MVAQIHEGLAIENYLQGEGISSSGCRLFLRSPAHYQASFLARITTDKPSLRIGSALHRLIEDAKAFAVEYVVKPDGIDGRTKAGKEWLLAHGDKNVLSQGEFADLTCMAANVRKQSRLMRILAHGKAEVTILWHDEQTGLLCKARPDWLNPKLRIVLDWKTTEDARPEAVRRTILKYGYHHQAEWYLRAVEAPTTFVWAFIEKSPPYAVACYTPSKELLGLAWEGNTKALHGIKACMDADTWPAYDESIQIVE